MIHGWREEFEEELPRATPVSQKEREEVSKEREVALYEQIHAERANLPVARACRVLQVSRTGYYNAQRAVCGSDGGNVGCDGQCTAGWTSGSIVAIATTRRPRQVALKTLRKSSRDCD